MVALVVDVVTAPNEYGSVCSGLDIARKEVVDLVAGLVDKSILHRTGHDTDTPARYRMLEAIRHYGQEQVAASPARRCFWRQRGVV
jgi:hypothetical protein